MPNMWTDQIDTAIALVDEQPIEIKKRYCPGCNKTTKIRFYLNYYWCKSCNFRERI